MKEEVKRDRERGYSFGGYQGIQAKAIERYADMLDWIILNEGSTAPKLFAYMFETWGTTEKTVGRYLKVAIEVGKIEIEGQILRMKKT